MVVGEPGGADRGGRDRGVGERALTAAEIFLPGDRHPNRVGVRLGH